MHRGPSMHKIYKHYLRLKNEATTRFSEKSRLVTINSLPLLQRKLQDFMFSLHLHITKMLILFLGRILSSSWIMKIIPRLSNELWLSQSIQIKFNGKQLFLILKLVERIADERKCKLYLPCSILLQTQATICNIAYLYIFYTDIPLRKGESNLKL
jgi:hypothetical protein